MKIMKSIMLFLIVSIILMTSGCTGTAMETYQNALDKTENINKGKSKFTLDMDLKLTENNENNFQPLTIEQLTFENKFAKTRSIAQSTIYAKVNNYGIDAKMYQNGEIYYLISPLFPKIIVLNMDDLANLKDANGNPIVSIDKDSQSINNDEILTDETKVKLETIWSKLTSDKDVTKLSNILISTPEGEVKAKEYLVNLTSEDLQHAILESIDILSKDPLLNKKFFADNDFFNEDKISLADFWAENKRFIENAEIGPLSYLAFIDRDGYIIEEKLNVEIRATENQYTNFEMGIDSFSFNYQIQRWDIEKEVEIELPKITEENFITLQQLINEDEFSNQWGRKVK